MLRSTICSWFIGEWSDCSTKCLEGVQFRSVYCQQVMAGAVASVVDSDQCASAVGPKPASVQSCNQLVACPQWHVEDWSPVRRFPCPIFSKKIQSSTTNLVSI